MTKSGLFGEYSVVPKGSAIAQAETLSKGAMRPYNILRRHALKLALWPDGADADWDWIKSLETLHIGEFQIDEDIAGNNNVRVIFLKPTRHCPRIRFQNPAGSCSGFGSLQCFRRSLRDFPHRNSRHGKV